MNRQSVSPSRFRTLALSGALILLMLWAGSAPHAAAAVTLIYFTATPSSDSIELEWQTGTENDTAGFNLYRSEDSSSQGQQIGDTFPAQGSSTSGDTYSFSDTDVTPGVQYFYTLEEILASSGIPVKIADAAAGIGVPTLTPTATATATATRSATATATATATGSAPTATSTRTATRAPGATGTPQENPTATRQFTNTPRPPNAATNTPPAGASTPLPPGQASATPVLTVVVATATRAGQPPTATAAIEPSATPQPFASAAPAGPSPSAPAQAVTPTQEAQPTPQATRTPKVFEPAKTGQPLLGTPAPGSRPTGTPAGQGARNTRTILLLSGGAIALAALLGAAALIVWRTRSR